MELSGHIYVLINPSLDGLVKIGKTARSPDERAKELSQATGVATPFYVAFSIQVADCHYAEEFVHAILDHNGFRLSKSREFFQMPLQKAIEVLLLAQQHLQQNSFGIRTDETGLAGDDSSEPFREHPGRAIFCDAVATFYGFEDTICDEEQAVRLLQKAKALDFPAAYTALSCYYLDHLSCRGDNEKECIERARQLLREGADKGHGRCFIPMSYIYFRKGEHRDAFKCWKKYFQSRTFSKNDDAKWTSPTEEELFFYGIDGLYDQGHDRAFHAHTYLGLVFEHNLPIDEETKRILGQIKPEILRQSESVLNVFAEKAASGPEDERQQAAVVAEAESKLLEFVRVSI